MKVNQFYLALIILSLFILTHTLDFNMHELTKQQEGTFYTVGACFIGDISRRQYTYKVLNTIELQPRQLALVETASGWKVVKIITVHDKPAIDYSSSYEYRWIAASIDTTVYMELREQEQQWLNQNNNDKFRF